MAFGGSNWLDRVSPGLATLLVRQACLSPSLSCCSARQERSQPCLCHAQPFKEGRSWGWQQLLSQGSRGNAGPLVISGSQCALTSLDLRQLTDLRHPSSLCPSNPPFLLHPCQEGILYSLPLCLSQKADKGMAPCGWRESAVGRQVGVML